MTSVIRLTSGYLECLLGVNLHSVKLTSHLCSVSASRECWVVVTEVNLPSKNYAWKLNEIHVSFIGLLFMWHFCLGIASGMLL
jgi:hypothetical protein